MYIKSLNEAFNYAEKNKYELVAGYDITRKNGSKECKVLFRTNKPFASNFNMEEKNMSTRHLFKIRNITLWNNIDYIENPISRAALKSLYAFSIIILLPFADWAIGHLRNDKEIISFYSKNTNPSNPIESPITNMHRIGMRAVINTVPLA